MKYIKDRLNIAEVFYLSIEKVYKQIMEVDGVIHADIKNKTVHFLTPEKLVEYTDETPTIVKRKMECEVFPYEAIVEKDGIKYTALTKRATADTVTKEINRVYSIPHLRSF